MVIFDMPPRKVDPKPRCIKGDPMFMGVLKEPTHIQKVPCFKGNPGQIFRLLIKQLKGSSGA